MLTVARCPCAFHTVMKITRRTGGFKTDSGPDLAFKLFLKVFSNKLDSREASGPTFPCHELLSDVVSLLLQAFLQVGFHLGMVVGIQHVKELDTIVALQLKQLIRNCLRHNRFGSLEVTVGWRAGLIAQKQI